ncbi:MAG TPA: ABC transporter permease [Nitrososphaeraceae archaeon]|jgi:peptide/nickel transport system permease protein|nr:ABC transporter permease [Nitrososphaeraceae archaeon]
MFIVLFSVLVLTISLLGPTMDDVIKDTIRFNVIDSLSNQKVEFKDLTERQRYIDQQIALQIKNLGLEEPWYSPNRFLNTLFKVMMLDLGKSSFFVSDSGSSSVKDIMIEKIPKTLLLFTTSTLVIVIIGILLGIFLANRAESKLDRVNSIFAVFSNSIPVWWFGMIMIFIFAFSLNIFPARSTPLTPPDNPFYIFDLLYHMILPFITMVVLGFGSVAYIVRSIVSGILNEDFIKAKFAMGIPKRKILYSSALKNAAPPIVTMIALSLSGSWTGAYLVETVFDWPGMGKLAIDAIGLKDVPIIIGFTYVSALIYIITVFFLDIIYAYLDPRVKLNE